MNQPAARIKGVGDAALENSQFQPLKQQFDPVADTAGLGADRPECALEPPGSLGMISGKIEEFVEPRGTATFPRGCPVLRIGVADDRDCIHADAS